jgi:AcrR family transcriptional regulator
MNVSIATSQRPRRTQEERRAETRRKLIDATIQALQEHGAARMTMADVAEKAGLTRGAIQYHFDTPTELLKATVVEIAERMGGMIDIGALRGMELGPRIDALIDANWKAYTSGNYIAFLEIAVQGRIEPELGKVVRETLAEIELSRADTWTEIFADTGRTRDEIIAWRTALQVMARGLALSKMIAHQDAIVDPQVERFTTMLKQQLGAA